jgi:hypothetical protein
MFTQIAAPHKCVRCVKAKSVGVGVKILESTTARITKTDQDRPRLEVMCRQAITLSPPIPIITPDCPMVSYACDLVFVVI